MSSSPAGPAPESTGGSVTLRPPAYGARLAMMVVPLLYSAGLWTIGPPQFRPLALILAVGCTAAAIWRLWRLWRRPLRTTLSPAGITSSGRDLPWSTIVGIDVRDGWAGRYVKVRVTGRRRPVTLAAPTVDRGLRERPHGAKAFDAGVAEIGRWASTYAPRAGFDVAPSGGATAAPLVFTMLGLAVLVLLLGALFFALV